MRNLTPEMAAEFSGKSVFPILLADLGFDSGTLYMWTGVGDLSYNGNTYLGGGNLIGLSTVGETQELEAKGIVATLNGIPQSLIATALLERTRGRPFNMYLAAIASSHLVLTEDGSTVLVENSQPGAVITETDFVSSPYPMFSGMMDYMELDDKVEDATIALSVENALIIARRSKVKRYTSEEQKRTYPDDLGLDLINQLQDKEVVW